MALPISLQLLQAGMALLFGAAAGIVYDLLRTIRLLLRARAAEWICDALFCAGCAGGLFALGLSVGEGRQRGFLAAFVFLGMVFYRLTLSIPVRLLLDRVVRYVIRGVHFLLLPVKAVMKAAEKMKKNIKNLFHYSYKWVILYKSEIMPSSVWRDEASHARGERGNAVEVPKSRYIY